MPPPCASPAAFRTSGRNGSRPSCCQCRTGSGSNRRSTWIEQVPKFAEVFKKTIKAKEVFYFYPKKHSPRHASHAARPDSSLTLVLTVAWVTKKMLIEAVAHVRINNFFTWQPGQITCVGSLPKTGVTCCKKSKRNFSPFFTFWQIPHLNDDLLLWLLLLLRRPSLMIGLGPRLLLLRGRGVRRWSNNELRSSWARKFHIYFLRISIEYFKC